MSKRSIKLFRSKGSAAVEFVLVSVPLLMLSVAVLAVALAGYTRNVATYAAVEAVRFAALADQDSQAAVARTKEILASALFLKPTSVVCQRLANGWYQLDITLPIAGLSPLLGAVPSGNAGELKVSAHAPAEN